jgi:hypothetical protein
LIARCNVAIVNLGGVNGSDCTVAALVPLRAKAKVAAVVAKLVGLILCHGLRLSCLMGNRASPSVRCDYPSCTSAVYSHSCIPTVRSITQYNLSSILQFFLHTHCSHPGTSWGEGSSSDTVNRCWRLDLQTWHGLLDSACFASERDAAGSSFPGSHRIVLRFMG